LLFATRFLDTKINYPKYHRWILYLCLGFMMVEAIVIAAGGRSTSLLVSLLFIFFFTSTMVALGTVAYRQGNKSAKYFLIGSVTHVSTATITVMVALGFIPYQTLTYRSVEVGMVFDAILLAMALADQFRIIQADKLKAERLARADPLTSINNRRAFYELVSPIWSNGLRHQHPMTVILIDIDKFKLINDSEGHAVGDKVLVQMAAALKKEARSSDILARWGGEEFILFLPETALLEAVKIAERYRQKIATLRIKGNSKTFGITASMGVAQWEGAGETLDSLIHLADEHLYRAKEQGRDQVCSLLL